MENASKALIMAAGVLIGILILSLAVFLFADFGATSKGVYSQMEERQLTQYNAQYTVYEGRNDITIYDIVSLVNLAQENNEKYKDYTTYESEYEVKIFLQAIDNPSGITTLLHNCSEDQKIELIRVYSGVNGDGQLQRFFKCSRIDYHPNGKVYAVYFS